MLPTSRAPIWIKIRGIAIAAAPIFFLVLLGLWTILNVSISSVKADTAPNSAFAVVKRTSANLREGPGTQYRILGRSLKGAALPVVGKYDNAFGQRWYQVYLQAFGDVWVSGSVVSISPTNADIPFVNFSTVNGVENTPIPTEASPGVPSNNTSNSNSNNNSGNNNPPSNSPPPQPTAIPGPATTPEPGA